MFHCLQINSKLFHRNLKYKNLVYVIYNILYFCVIYNIFSIRRFEKLLHSFLFFFSFLLGFCRTFFLFRRSSILTFLMFGIFSNFPHSSFAFFQSFFPSFWYWIFCNFSGLKGENLSNFSDTNTMVINRNIFQLNNK